MTDLLFLLAGGLALWFIVHMLVAQVPDLTRRRERRQAGAEGVYLDPHVNELRAEIGMHHSIVRHLNQDPVRTNPLDPGSRSEGDR